MKIHFASQTCIEFILFTINHLWISYMVTNWCVYITCQFLDELLKILEITGGWLWEFEEKDLLKSGTNKKIFELR